VFKTKNVGRIGSGIKEDSGKAYKYLRQRVIVTSVKLLHLLSLNIRNCIKAGSPSKRRQTHYNLPEIANSSLQNESPKGDGENYRAGRKGTV